MHIYIKVGLIGSIAKFWSSDILSLSDICTILFRKFWNRIFFARKSHYRQNSVQWIGVQTCLINVSLTLEARVVPFFHIDLILWQDSMFFFIANGYKSNGRHEIRIELDINHAQEMIEEWIVPVPCSYPVQCNESYMYSYLLSIAYRS